MILVISDVLERNFLVMQFQLFWLGLFSAFVRNKGHAIEKMYRIKYNWMICQMQTEKQSVE